ncbi:hypothetical protein ACLMJK_005732 [Lecanora helva]
MDPRNENSFSTLPVEIRSQIFRFVLTPPPKGPLRRLNDIPTPHDPVNINLLLVSKLFHAETVLDFYRLNTFHFKLDDYADFPSASLGSSNLTALKHVSIASPCTVRGKSDSSLGKNLEVLSKECPTLKTLTIHLLPIPASDGIIPDEHFIACALGSKTAHQLRTLRHRLDRISLVTIGLSDSLLWLRHQISDTWIIRSHQSWPALSLPLSQQRVLSANMRRGSSIVSNQYYVLPIEITSFHACKQEVRGEFQRKLVEMGEGVEAFW